MPNAKAFSFTVSTANVGSVTSTGGQVANRGSNCGCSGGGKFWNTTDAVVTGNYVHDNGAVGIWVDTDNAGFDISDNYIANNRGAGIDYEISYKLVRVQRAVW